MRVTVADTLVFAAEMAVYGAVAWAGWSLLPRAVPAVVAAVVGVVVMACWWGLFHAPKAPLHLPRVLELALRGAWFGLGLMAALAAATAGLAGRP